MHLGEQFGHFWVGKGLRRGIGGIGSQIWLLLIFSAGCEEVARSNGHFGASVFELTLLWYLGVIMYGVWLPGAEVI